VDIRAHTGFDDVGFEDGAATQLSTPGQVEEIRRSLAAQAQARGRAAAPDESDATMLGGPSFVEEVRAQLAAAGVAAPDAFDEDAFAPESGIRDAVNLLEDDEPESQREDPLADPVIAAILAADEPEPTRPAAAAKAKASAVHQHADDVWGPITTQADPVPPPPRGGSAGGRKIPPPKAPPPPPPMAAATMMEMAPPDLDLPPPPPVDDDFDVDFLDEPEEPPPPKPAPAPRPAAPRTRLTPAPPVAARPPAAPAAKVGSGPKARPPAADLLPDVLKPAPVSPPLRTHRVGPAAGKLLLAVPEGARVTVERAQAGVGNLLLVGMEPQARVAVEVSVDGYTPWRSMVSLGGKPTGQVKVELRKPGR
jgi:hypothetical protein